MALSSSFRERLEHMEQTRNQRLSLLQAEKEVQANKYQVLQSKLSNVRSIERRCLKLDHKISSQHVVVSFLKAEIDRLSYGYAAVLQQFRVLKSEVDELEELDKEKDKYFASKTREMEEFRTQVEKFGGECRRSVEVLRYVVMELRSTFIELQGKSGCSNNSEIATAEMRKSELLGMKEKIERSLASNYDLRTQLQKQLQSILISQNQDGQRLLKQV